MIVDTSAFIAIALREPGFPMLAAAILNGPAGMSAVSALEARIVLGSERLAVPAATIDALFERTGIQVVEFTVAHSEAAAIAYGRFGKGNHAARLNMGDCASYATAQLAARPLLFVGDDFAQTDVARALTLD